MEGFERSDMPEEMLSRYRELFGEIAKKVSYTAGGAGPAGRRDVHRAGDGQSITLFTDTYGTFQSRAQEYAEEVTDRVTAGLRCPQKKRCRNRSMRYIMRC